MGCNVPDAFRQVCQTMKPSTFKKPKMARVARPERRRTRLYSTAMYRLQKEVNAVSRPISIPARTSALALYNMGLEAARLAKLNKRRAITWEERMILTPTLANLDMSSDGSWRTMCNFKLRRTSR
ncbi:hypothetical protein GN956_G3918 [Arapaima gigas]